MPWGLPEGNGKSLRDIKMNSPQALKNTAAKQLLVRASACLPELRVDMPA
jgi:hypothetical protein